MQKPMRLLIIIKMLEKNESLTISILSEKLNRTKRTIYRDIEYLIGLDVPISFDKGIISIDLILWKNWIDTICSHE